MKTLDFFKKFFSTIIVLLILAGVSISMVVGENGVLNRAQNATDETAKAQAKEALSMAVSGLQGVFAGDIAKGSSQKFISYIWYGGAEKTGTEDESYTGATGQSELQKQLKDYTITTFSSTGATKKDGPISVTIYKGTAKTPTWTFSIESSGDIGAVVK